MNSRAFPILATFIVAGCAHVGVSDVLDRAVVDLACDSDHLIVQTIARNTYTAVGCGELTVFVCRSGACTRDSPSDSGPESATARRDAQRAHEQLEAVREAALACNDGYSMALKASFDPEGNAEIEHDMGTTVARRACFETAFENIRLDPPPAYPTTLQHRLTRVPWTAWQPRTSGSAGATP